jgi:very-short-patch-repair endonuclease
MTPVDGRRDAAVAALAGRQRTIVSHEQLLGLGCPPRVIAHWVNRGRMQVRFQGVYSIVAGDLPPLAREQAALLACGDRAFLSYQSAAFIWGMLKAPRLDVDVSVVGRYRRCSKGIRVHRIQAIDPREVRLHEGLWVSAPARAVLELAATGTSGELARAIDEGLAHRLFTPPELRDVLARNRPCRGAARLAAILGDETATAVSRSRTEKRLLRLLREAGLPLPDTNVGFGRFEIDFLWRRERLAVEVDGYPFHRGPAAHNRDIEKGLAIRDAGIELLRFTSDHVHQKSAMVIAGIARELARRAVAD